METLVRHYERPVFNAAFRMLGDREDAADVAQTTFLKAFRNIHQFNPEFKFFSWIYRIAINESINFLKRQPQSEPLQEGDAKTSVGPADEAQADQMSHELQAALMELPEDYRSVIALHYFAGCSYRQMAETLRIPEKTVKSRLFTARQKIRDVLAQHGIHSS
jgi:RNA polymerase sigma-70 factor (ECF subfamily)